MIALLLAILLSSSKSEIPPDMWRCANNLEVWCVVDGCAAKAEDETTPFDIWLRGDGAFSVCAYSGCWDGEGVMTNTNGRRVWAGDDVAFDSPSGGFSADVTVLMIEREGVGFVRVGGVATPLLCRRAGPMDGGPR
ncbi:MAG: hypothetical protein AAFW81_05015 [Pseudomonadota bacterium]